MVLETKASECVLAHNFTNDFTECFDDVIGHRCTFYAVMNKGSIELAYVQISTAKSAIYT